MLYCPTSRPPRAKVNRLVLFAVDISSSAAVTTETTLVRNCPRQFSSVIQCDLFSGLRLSGQIDVLVFNPPYVPVDEDDSWAGDIGFAWKGGGMGMSTTWKVLDSLKVSYRLV
jgi:release factor glutamine methyltransferase